MAIARGQITITDLNDGRSVNMFLGANQGLTQIFNRENSSYEPNYASRALVITPELFVSGEAGNAMAQVKSVPVWKINGSTSLQAWGTVAQTHPYALTINKNLDTLSQLNIECEADYTDPLTKAITKAKSQVTITKTENAGQLICAIATAPKGTIFKQGGLASLEAKCDLWRGSTIDNSNVSYQWYKLSASGSWEALTNAKAYGCTGYNTNTLTIPSSAVLNFESFKCEIKDTDRASGTYNTVVADVISFADLSDPYQVEILSPAGDKLVRGQGSLTLTAQVWQKGNLIEDNNGAKFNYVWRKYNANGTADASWGSSGTKQGRTLTVTGADISTKATFVCEITAK